MRHIAPLTYDTAAFGNGIGAHTVAGVPLHKCAP